MTDVFTVKKRSQVMSRIRSKNTSPELAVRKALHSQGFRYKLHDPKLAGRPDIVMPGRKAIVLVQGCFWHAHHCKTFRLPLSNSSYWSQKLARNRERDKANISEWRARGWRVFLIWECSLESDVSDTVGALRGGYV